MIFLHRIQWQREVGLIRREEVRWVPKKPKCEGGQGFKTVGLSEVKPAIILLLIGYGLSVGIAITEFLYRIIRNRHPDIFERIQRRKPIRK